MKNTEIPEEYIKSGRALAWLSYFGLFLIIPAILQRNNPFTVFHVKQGMGLLITNTIFILLCLTLKFPMVMCQFISLVLLIINLIGIYNAIVGKVKPLPLIGFIGENLNF